MSHPAFNEERLIELMAADQLGEITPEERAELLSLSEQRDPNAPRIPETLGELLVLLDAIETDKEQLPARLAERVSSTGRSIVGNASHTGQDSSSIAGSISAETDPFHKRADAGSMRWGWIAAIAAAVAISGSIWGVRTSQRLGAERIEHARQLELLQVRLDGNQAILDQSKAALALLETQIEGMNAEASQRETLLAEALRKNTDLATQLAEANIGLEDATRRIAIYEQPTDPAELAGRRQRLLDVPDAIQIAWQPFDLPDAPAEQRAVRGDVVWSDTEQRGYIRFVGLNVNDPSVEQYQVWVIDERGLEQKVSGGIFNASAAGEIIVPIEPGIDVGRVALFAVTVEAPGGTWVPDLSRRIVVAPRQDG